jgi:hypothetical protein
MNNTMTVHELIEKLRQVEDKNLDVRIVDENNDEANIWLHSVEVSDTGESGYEVEGEVRLIGNE